jgi:hypothetical protein
VESLEIEKLFFFSNGLQIAELPDDIFSNQKSPLGIIWRALE